MPAAFPQLPPQGQPLPGTAPRPARCLPAPAPRAPGNAATRRCRAGPLLPEERQPLFVRPPPPACSRPAPAPPVQAPRARWRSRTSRRPPGSPSGTPRQRDRPLVVAPDVLRVVPGRGAPAAATSGRPAHAPRQALREERFGRLVLASALAPAPPPHRAPPAAPGPPPAPGSASAPSATAAPR